MVFNLLSELGMGVVPALKNIPSLYNGQFFCKLGGIEKMFFTLQRTFFLRLDGYQKIFPHFTTDKIFEIGGVWIEKIIPSPYNGHFRCGLSHGFAKIHRKFLFKKEHFILQRTFFCRL